MRYDIDWFTVAYLSYIHFKPIDMQIATVLRKAASKWVFAEGQSQSFRVTLTEVRYLGRKLDEY